MFQVYEGDMPPAFSNVKFVSIAILPAFDIHPAAMYGVDSEGRMWVSVIQKKAEWIEVTGLPKTRKLI